MRFWKVAALIALAAIPLLLLGKKRDPRPEYGDADNIFEQELSGD